MPPLLANIGHWDFELKNDPDRQFILDGISNGFSLIDKDVNISQISDVFVQNSASVYNPDTSRKVHNKICDEIDHGHYVLCEDKPRVVSAISVVPKPDGDIRLIHDLSRPPKCSVNDYASKESFKYQTVTDALKLIKPHSFMAKVDLKSAYRSVHIRPDQYKLTGLSWGHHKPQYMYDTRLPFGARKSPSIFNRLTQAVCRIMRRKGFTGIVAYLDDFFVCGDSFTDCLNAYNCLISLLRKLGFWINWNKLCDPCQKLTFLGISIDTVSGYLSLDPPKVQDLISLLNSYLTKTRASRRQLESLAGKLNWAAHVIPWGKTHTRRVYSLFSP